MNRFTSGIIGDNPRYYLVSCSAYNKSDDMTAFELSKMWHKLDEDFYIDNFEIKYCKISFTEGMKFNIEWCESKTQLAYECRLYKIKRKR